MLKRFLFAGLLVIIYTCTFAQTAPPAFNSGISQDSTYINAFFNFQITIPKGWNIGKTKHMEEIVKRGSDAMVGNDVQYDSNVKASLQRTGYLLMANKYALGAPVPFNPGLMLMSEDISLFEGVSNGSDYLYHVKQAINKGQHLEAKEIKKMIINGQEFGLMEAVTKSHVANPVKQFYYSTIINRHSIAFILSYQTDDQYAELKSVADSFTMLKK